MTAREEAADYIAAMCSRRRNLSPNERDILHQLLDTPAIRSRFATFTLEELEAIADEVTAPPVEPSRPSGTRGAPTRLTRRSRARTT